MPLQVDGFFADFAAHALATQCNCRPAFRKSYKETAIFRAAPRVLADAGRGQSADPLVQAVTATVTDTHSIPPF